MTNTMPSVTVHKVSSGKKRCPKGTRKTSVTKRSICVPKRLTIKTKSVRRPSATRSSARKTTTRTTVRKSSVVRKRPLSAYNRFVRKMMPEFLKKHPNVSPQSRMKLIAKEWRKDHPKKSAVKKSAVKKSSKK